MFSLFEKSRRSVACSFDNGYFRYVLVERTKKGIQVVDYGSSFFGTDVISLEGDILQDAVFVQKIREILPRIDFRAAIPEMRMVIPDGQAIIFHAHVSKNATQSMKDTLHRFVAHYCDAHDLGSLQDYTLEFQVFHETPMGYDTHITLAPKRYTQHIVRLMKQAGVEVREASVACHSVASSCLMTGGEGTGTILISFGEYSSTVALLHHHRLISQERIPVGKDNIRKVIKRFLNATDEYVEKIIEKHGVMQTHPDNGLLSEIYLELAPLYRSVHQQIMRAHEVSYKTIAERFTTRGLVLYGVGVHIKGLAGFLAEKTNLQVSYLDVWAHHTHERAPIIEMPLDQTYLYAEPLSLALMHLEK